MNWIIPALTAFLLYGILALLYKLPSGDKLTIVATITLFMFLTVFLGSLFRGFDVQTVKSQLPLLAGIGIVAGLAYFIFIYSIQVGPVSLVSTIRGLSFIISVIGGVLFFKESLPVTKVLAIVLASISLVLLAL